MSFSLLSFLLLFLFFPGDRAEFSFFFRRGDQGLRGTVVTLMGGIVVGVVVVREGGIEQKAEAEGAGEEEVV